MAKPEPHQKENRLSIRADLAQKNFLAEAARVRHMNLSQFVLQASLKEAEQVISEEKRIILSADEYAWACKLMDEAPRDAHRLREALAQPPVWDA